MNYILFVTLMLLTGCGEGNNKGKDEPKPKIQVNWTFSPETLTDFGPEGGSQKITITTNTRWVVKSDQAWCTLSAVEGFPESYMLTVTASKNNTLFERRAVLTFTASDVTKLVSVKQAPGTDETGSTENESGFVPAGYNLVWQDEFNTARLTNGKPALPNTADWWYENFAKGTVNNELQTYVGGYSGTDTTAAIYNGTLKITARKKGSEVISARINTVKSWTYGYFEARLRMPAGKGTWPAFWMMPKNFQNWPLDGEIDIMEYVGYDPNVVVASIHTQSYNHTLGTQKTASRRIQNAETEFHIYALEWTADKMDAYVDGVKYFTFVNDKTGNKNTWPFNAPFYLKLNLAWGGNWGGAQGIDPNALPATYEIDYVRVYQK